MHSVSLQSMMVEWKAKHSRTWGRRKGLLASTLNSITSRTSECSMCNHYEREGERENVLTGKEG